MKAKKSALYECQHCGWQSSKWLGKCPNCNAWESLIELGQDYIRSLQQNPIYNKNSSQHTKALPITQVKEEIIDYFSSTQSELDIVLGGGIVRGGLYLIGGSPGVGKSTLLLKVAGGLANGSSYQDIRDNYPQTESLIDSKKTCNIANENLKIKIDTTNARKEQSATITQNLDFTYDLGGMQGSECKSRKTIFDENLDSNNYQIEHSKKSNLDSKKDYSLLRKANNDKEIESKNYHTKQNISNNMDLNVAQGKKVLYVSGEESLSQIYNRAKRCQCLSDNLYLLSEINILEIKEALLSGGFEVCIIDSIQTIYSPNLSAAPGSVSQVREITFELMRLAKSFNIAMFIIGHITKDGQIAGPRVLEHMVDCVLYFEGEKSNELKILRGFKNRFGTTSEIGIFEMRANGLVSANEATKKFFNAKKDMPGSAAVAIMEGSRCIVVEIQALTCENEFGVPKRLTNGFDSNRLNMILALLEKKLGIHLHRHDVFVNVAGGIKISETSADLALIASILSSYKNRPLRSSTAFIGEVSLIGDIREVGGLEARLKELANFGFKNAIVPNIPKSYKGQVKCVQAIEVAQIIEWM